MNEKTFDVQAIRNWLTDVALGDIELESHFLDFCEQLVEAGFPLVRSHIAMRSLHPMYVASTVTWDRDNLSDSARIQPEDDNRVDWLKRRCTR
jgi:hypothetical protein